MSLDCSPHTDRDRDDGCGGGVYNEAGGCRWMPPPLATVYGGVGVLAIREGFHYVIAS